MTGYRIVNLKILVEEIGEDAASRILSDFSCPMNPDVENFLRKKAIDFAKHGWSQTHLVFTSYKGQPVLVGYFTLANKYIKISSKYLGRASGTLRKRISQFATFDRALKEYILSAPLIAQLGKNYTNDYNKLITGSELLEEACKKIAKLQFDVGGKFTYIECEDKPKLVKFYSDNGFCIFDYRELDRDETASLDGDYLVQMLKYLK